MSGGEAACDGEVFDVLDEEGRVVGQERRLKVQHNVFARRPDERVAIRSTKQGCCTRRCTCSCMMGSEGYCFSSARRPSAFALGLTSLIRLHKRLTSVCNQSLWDLSCAEHLQVGETQIEAAVRGLKEELGLDVAQSQLTLVRPGA